MCSKGRRRLTDEYSMCRRPVPRPREVSSEASSPCSQSCACARVCLVERTSPTHRFHRAAVLFGLYIIIGTFYNRYVLELRGMDQFPRISFFSFTDTVEFVRNCVGRFKDRSSDTWQSRNWGAQSWSNGGGSWGSSGRHGYSGLRTTPEEGETMLGGPPGFLDEQDEEDEESGDGGHGMSGGGQEQRSGMDANGVIRL